MFPKNFRIFKRDPIGNTGLCTKACNIARCGDGFVQPANGESCDDGAAFNLLSAACLPDCSVARCGDGHVQAGIEECDDGDSLNSFSG